MAVTNPTLTGLEYGIQMVGVAPAVAMGNVTFTNVTVTGDYVKAGAAFDTFADVNGLSFVDPDGAGSESGLTANVSAAFAGINFDNIGGTLNLSGEESRPRTLMRPRRSTSICRAPPAAKRLSAITTTTSSMVRPAMTP